MIKIQVEKGAVSFLEWLDHNCLNLTACLPDSGHPDWMIWATYNGIKKSPVAQGYTIEHAVTSLASIMSGKKSPITKKKKMPIFYYIGPLMMESHAVTVSVIHK
jgi:hypothetical protein